MRVRCEYKQRIFLLNLFTTWIWLGYEEKDIRSRFPKDLLCGRGMKNGDFGLISRFISETIQDIAVVTMEDK